MAKDAVQTACEKFLSGERRHWDWSKSDFDNFWAAVSGEIINRATGAENSRTSRIDGDDKIVQFPAPEPGPDKHTEWRLLRAQFLRFLRAEDRKVAQMARWMLNQDLSSSKDLAKVMGLKPHEVDALKKKLKKLVKKFRGDFGNDYPEAAE